MNTDLIGLSKTIGRLLTAKELTIAAAESCTGGLLASTLTDVSGSSAYMIGGVVAYANRIKENVLDVKTDTLARFGAVSSQTAEEMAQGICRRFGVDIGLSTTGIAGPSGGTPENPVGLVWLGLTLGEKTTTIEYHFEGTRLEIKNQTVQTLLEKLLLQLTK